MPRRSRERDSMVELQIARRGVRDRHVLGAMRQVPREVFVPPGSEEFAYHDTPLSIGEGQTISQPHIVALMIEAAQVRPCTRALEIGAGSGYAAAVISRIAERVYAIERHAKLTEQAQARFHRLGYDNVVLRTGDGTLGWPDAAPFDAILVAAGAPAVPEALKRQLTLGGSLVIPVNHEGRHQKLMKVTRTSEEIWEEEEITAVMFVPLIGAEGWSEDGTRASTNHVAARERSLPEMIAAAAEPLSEFDNTGFGRLFNRWADRRVVLLGEASHGTSEFYRARAAITRHLIENHGFRIIAVEADWPDAAAVDRHVRHRLHRATEEHPFSSFPTWMWRNTDVAKFIEWLRAHNKGQPPEHRAGFYGLDIYNMSGSIAAVLAYLDEIDPDAARIARERYGCLMPWQKDPATYGRAVLTDRYRNCEREVVAQLRDLLNRKLRYEREDGTGFPAQNARLVASAERYYKVMYYGRAESWNLRDTHMFETLEHLLEAGGPDAKAVVWAHNSHIGDLRHTEMGAARGELNIGQLCREKFGHQAALIGFGTHSGTVAAATDWDGAMEVKRVRPSREDSYERLCHDAGIPRFLLDLHAEPALRKRLSDQRLERFIGVIYRPENELMSHYADACLPRQFDAWVWFDETNAVTPLGPTHAREGVPETYPFGL